MCGLYLTTSERSDYLFENTNGILIEVSVDAAIASVTTEPEYILLKEEQTNGTEGFSR